MNRRLCKWLQRKAGLRPAQTGSFAVKPVITDADSMYCVVEANVQNTVGGVDGGLGGGELQAGT